MSGIPCQLSYRRRVRPELTRQNRVGKRTKAIMLRLAGGHTANQVDVIFRLSNDTQDCGMIGGA
jgi:hypothetical protein